MTQRAQITPCTSQSAFHLVRGAVDGAGTHLRPLRHQRDLRPRFMPEMISI